MIATLQEGQKDLRRLVERASSGEDVVFLVDGTPKAKLTRADSPSAQQVDLAAWLKDLEGVRSKYSTDKRGPSVEQILSEDRADRV